MVLQIKRVDEEVPSLCLSEVLAVIERKQNELADVIYSFDQKITRENGGRTQVDNTAKVSELNGICEVLEEVKVDIQHVAWQKSVNNGG